jgi:O-methyltransferase
MGRDLMAEGPGTQRRKPSAAWKVAKAIYRRSISLRSRIPLLHTLFTEKEQMLNVAMQYVAFNRIEGDYLEFGCYEGNSFVAAHHLAQAQRLQAMRFYAFDSFAGLPDADGIDVDPDTKRQYSEGDFACDVRSFRRNLRRSGVDLEKTRLVEGFYSDSLTPETREQLPVRSAAVVLIDCDFYESTRDVLEFIGPYLQHGSLLLFDDWYNFRGDPLRGEQRAFTEWLAANPRFSASRYINFGWHGLSFIIHAADA